MLKTKQTESLFVTKMHELSYVYASANSHLQCPPHSFPFVKMLPTLRGLTNATSSPNPFSIVLVRSKHSDFIFYLSDAVLNYSHQCSGLIPPTPDTKNLQAHRILLCEVELRHPFLWINPVLHTMTEHRPDFSPH